jgi:NADPH:quinone reductase-like Zn-dependent oxidoreductase
MKAIRIHQHGDAGVLKIEEMPVPEPGAREVRIRIRATSINHMDIWVRQGIPGVASLPLTLGCDGAGTVDALGSEVTHVKPADRVFIFPLSSCGTCPACLAGRINLCRGFQIYGEHRQGLHAEYVCVAAENVMPVPTGLSFEQAAAFPLVTLTAWHMLAEAGALRPGEDVLIMGSSGGVGSMAIQIAKLLGSRVIATAGGEVNVKRAQALGADAVIDHYKEKIAARVKELTAGRGVDLVFEHVGEKVWAEALKSLAWGGRLVTCGATTGPHVTMDLRHIFIKQQRIIGSTLGTRADMLRIAGLVGRGLIKPIIDRIFPFCAVADSHRHLASGHGLGKVVLAW